MDVGMGHPPMPGSFPFPQQTNSPFDRNGAISAYKQVQNLNQLNGFNAGNFHHDMMQRKSHEGYSEDDEYGQAGSGKRKLDDAMQRQQHSNREKKRRNEMNEAIESLKLLLPQSDKNRFRVTKVSVLNESIEYIQRIKELCMVLAKDKRELHDDNARLHQQLASLGKDVGEPRRWDDRNLMETLQSSSNIQPPQPIGEFPHGFPFGMGGPMPPHMAVPFHPGMMGHPQMRLPGAMPPGAARGGPIPPHMEFNPMYPFPFPPNGADFRGQFPQRDGQGELVEGFPGPGFPNQPFPNQPFPGQELEGERPEQEYKQEPGQDLHQQAAEQDYKQQEDTQDLAAQNDLQGPSDQIDNEQHGQS